MPRGELKLIIGNMFGNKTGRLILEIETLRQFGKRRVLVLKPDTDTRSGECLIRDYHGKSMEAVEVPARDPWAALRIVREKEAEAGSRFNLIAFDEVQFFAADSGFFRVVDELLERGYGVLASGLALDFKGEPFGFHAAALWTLPQQQRLHLAHAAMRPVRRAGAAAAAPDRRTSGAVQLAAGARRRQGDLRAALLRLLRAAGASGSAVLTQASGALRAPAFTRRAIGGHRPPLQRQCCTLP
jgi:thymidine kinase